MTHLILTRHGTVAGIDPPRFRGRQELDLDARGHAEAAALARRIASAFSPAVVYASPMKRAQDTAQPVAEACGVPLETLPALQDIDYGRWQGMTHEAVEAAEPALFALWHDRPHLVRFPDGESLQDLLARTADALRHILGRHGADESVVLVGHDSVNRALLMQLLEQPLSAYWRIAQSPSALSEIRLDLARPRILRLNDTSHLDAL